MHLNVSESVNIGLDNKGVNVCKVIDDDAEFVFVRKRCARRKEVDIYKCLYLYPQGAPFPSIYRVQGDSVFMEYYMPLRKSELADFYPFLHLSIAKINQCKLFNINADHFLSLEKKVLGYDDDSSGLYAKLKASMQIKYGKNFGGVVFSHNDLNINNIGLQNKFEHDASNLEKLVFIDFGLSCGNFIGADLAPFLRSVCCKESKCIFDDMLSKYSETMRVEEGLVLKNCMLYMFLRHAQRLRWLNKEKAYDHMLEVDSIINMYV